MSQAESSLWDLRMSDLSVPASHAVPGGGEVEGGRGREGSSYRCSIWGQSAADCLPPSSVTASLKSQGQVLGLGLPHSSLQSRSHLTDGSNLKQLSASFPHSLLHFANSSGQNRDFQHLQWSEAQSLLSRYGVQCPVHLLCLRSENSAIRPYSVVLKWKLMLQLGFTKTSKMME